MDFSIDNQCCRCCAELGDDTLVLYEYNGELYCESCLIEKLIGECVISERRKEHYDHGKN